MRGENLKKVIVTVGSLRFERGDFTAGDILEVSDELAQRLQDSVREISSEQEQAIKELKEEDSKIEVKPEQEKAVRTAPKNLPKRKRKKAEAKPATSEAEVSEDALKLGEQDYATS